MSRGLDPLLVAAYDAQADLVAEWLAGLTDADLEQPSSLPGWRIAELAVHLAHVSSAYADALAAAPPPRGVAPLTVAAYVGHYPGAAAEIVSREIAAAQGMSSDEVRELYVEERRRARRQLELLAGSDPVVAARRGPIRASAMLRTRVNELVVHAIDAGAAVDRQALRVSVRMLAEVLAERHPGKAVEVRVPPYAAVQVGAGVRHTRGTPPNVVECAPLVFLAVAAGRRSWTGAVMAGEVSASGSRADLSPFLPLL
ncbi:MAG: sterol carrier family protein [Mycobacteriales bacterium]